MFLRILLASIICLGFMINRYYQQELALTQHRINALSLKPRLSENHRIDSQKIIANQLQLTTLFASMDVFPIYWDNIEIYREKIMMDGSMEFKFLEPWLEYCKRKNVFPLLQKIKTQSQNIYFQAQWNRNAAS